MSAPKLFGTAMVSFMALWLLAFLVFGYPGLIIPALLAVLVMFVIIIILTANDL